MNQYRFWTSDLHFLLSFNVHLICQILFAFSSAISTGHNLHYGQIIKNIQYCINIYDHTYDYDWVRSIDEHNMSVIFRSNTIFGTNTVERRYSSKLGTNNVERTHLV